MYAYVEQCLHDSLFRDVIICYLYIFVLFHVLVVLQVPFLAFRVGVGAYKQGEEESLCWIPGRSFFHIINSLRKT